MDLSTVEIPRAGARERAAEYVREARRTNDPEARRELEEIAHAYRTAASSDVALISLSATIAAGGTIERTRVFWRGTPSENRKRYLLPRLAAIRSDARYVYTLGIEADGVVRFVDRLRPPWRLVSGRLAVDAGFALPDGFGAGTEIGPYDSGGWSAMVPIVPPRHRPARSRGQLRSYLTLFEVENWEWESVPAPPGDPALLRHLAGDLYAVLATWDLTELERLVLSGRRR